MLRAIVKATVEAPLPGVSRARNEVTAQFAPGAQKRQRKSHVVTPANSRYGITHSISLNLPVNPQCYSKQECVLRPQHALFVVSCKLNVLFVQFVQTLCFTPPTNPRVADTIRHHSIIGRECNGGSSTSVGFQGLQGCCSWLGRQQHFMHSDERAC